MTYKKYSTEFKLEIVNEVKKGYNMSCKKIANRYKINVNTIKNWTIESSNRNNKNNKESKEIDILKEEIKRKEIEIKVLEGLLTKRMI